MRTEWGGRSDRCDSAYIQHSTINYQPELNYGRDYCCRGGETARNDQRGHDGLQEGAYGGQGRPDGGRGHTPQEGRGYHLQDPRPPPPRKPPPARPPPP